MKFKIEKVPLPTLGCHIYVVITKDFDHAMDKIFQDDAKIFKPGNETARASTCHYNQNSYVFFYPDATPGEVAHEMWHAVRRQFKRIGAKLENELVAYHLEYMVTEGVDILKKWARKVK